MPQQRLLLAHQNADCLKIYGSVLEHAGYEVVVADTGDRALLALRQSAVDLLITDLYLSSSEDECLVRLVRRGPWAHLPVIVLTGWSTAPHRRLALEEGADVFFALPLGPRQLVQAVRELLAPSDVAPSIAPWPLAARDPGGDAAAHGR
jgi:DNA-binding response OmpR family regulator